MGAPKCPSEGEGSLVPHLTVHRALCPAIVFASNVRTEAGGGSQEEVAIPHPSPVRLARDAVDSRIASPRFDLDPSPF